MPKSKTAKAAKPSVPSWMDNVLKVKPKNSRRKSALQKKVAKVYKDTILPGHDEREGPTEVEDILIDTSDEPAIVPEPSESISAKKPLEPKTDISGLVGDVMNSISTLHKRVELAENAEHDIGRRPLRRPPADTTPGCIFANVRDALAKVVQMYLDSGDYVNVAKYSTLMLEMDELTKKNSPTVREGAIWKGPRAGIAKKAVQGKPVKATMCDPDAPKYDNRSVERPIKPKRWSAEELQQRADKTLDALLLEDNVEDFLDGDRFTAVTNTAGLKPGETKQIDQFLDRLKPAIGANLSRRPNTQNVSG